MARIRELDAAPGPVDTVEPERIEMIVRPFERVPEGLVEVGERLVAAHRDTPPDTLHIGEPGAKDEHVT
jgi:hypothetical protein